LLPVFLHYLNSGGSANPIGACFDQTCYGLKVSNSSGSFYSHALTGYSPEKFHIIDGSTAVSEAGVGFDEVRPA
jgi:hypothetical protein